MNPHSKEFQDQDIWVNEDPNYEHTEYNDYTLNAAQEGMYLIVSGIAKIVNSKDNHAPKLLKKGDYFGESEIIRVIGFDFFGDIIAESDKVETLFISKSNFQKIALFEQMNIK